MKKRKSILKQFCEVFKAYQQKNRYQSLTKKSEEKIRKLEERLEEEKRTLFLRQSKASHSAGVADEKWSQLNKRVRETAVVDCQEETSEFKNNEIEKLWAQLEQLTGKNLNAVIYGEAA